MESDNVLGSTAYVVQFGQKSFLISYIHSNTFNSHGHIHIKLLTTKLDPKCSTAQSKSVEDLMLIDQRYLSKKAQLISTSLSLTHCSDFMVWIPETVILKWDKLIAGCWMIENETKTDSNTYYLNNFSNNNKTTMADCRAMKSNSWTISWSVKEK